MALTGEYQFRKVFGGKIVLQVEEEVPTVWSWFGKPRMKRRWRDANLMDLSVPVLRMVVDWRFRSHRLTQVGVERPSGSAKQACPAGV